MDYKVYVVQNEEGRFYIGVSEDVLKRLEDHNNGVSKWTRYRGPWKLIWQSEELSLGDARKLENELKRQKGGAGFYARTGLQRCSSPGS
ncbi:GIY-YIG nuclease family protein [Roseimicrobium sp. ORNL1]|uniref:GIY-YIG nuclease family protein n=1 Tax=Roseimicrobium sp. ORNL1 TaxID=2711231 RepID=UPI0013E17186|nr:GIY-YIG nuclease family protein [Roseimicrobium sp. ORNL1]QIF03491.1 GIY-YIG nuclease family protein [Roseimicrobium sp. ORNL1]